MLFRSVLLASLVMSSAATISGVDDGSRGRHLSFTKIAGYEPETLVTDHAAIDLDQNAMMEQLAIAGVNAAIGNDRNNAAEVIYLNGAFSKVFADLQISPSLPKSLSKGTPILGGKSSANHDVSGTSYSDYDSGAEVIRFQYDVADLPGGRHVACIVGALPKGHPSINLSGCLGSEGTIVIDGDTYTYTYSPTTDNSNGRALARFSEHAQAKMYDCDNCPYDTYTKFIKYYEVFDYGHRWISAAFAGITTQQFLHGGADFSLSTQVGRTEAIQKGTVFLNVWMYVIREMEDAIDDCNKQCPECNDDPVHAWDEAVAFYAGSLQGTMGQGEGVLLYQLANKRCANFRTCGRRGGDLEGNSYVNEEIFHHFKAGQSDLLFGRCEETRPHKEAIEKLMAVPLVQGTLRYAYKVDREQGAGEKENAEGAVFAASVLPLVHHCNADDAAIIYENTKLGFMDPDFVEVKAAFERNYDCMGITCKQVGGLWDDGSNDYFPDAEPCGSGDSDDLNVRAILGGSLGGFTALLLIPPLCALGTRRKRGKSKYLTDRDHMVV